MSEKKKVGLMYTGGKDSTYACTKLRELELEVACLITMYSENKDSYMLHTPNIEITDLSSRAMNIPLVIGETKGRKEEELRDIRNTIIDAKRRYGIEAIGTGALASQYQRARLDLIGASCGFPVLSPLWGRDQEQYISNVISEGYEFILTSVSCEGLDKRWLGKEITHEALNELKYLSKKFKFNIAFEGGEAETLVVDCPLFTKRIQIIDSATEWNGYFGTLVIRSASLVDKPF